MEKEALSIIYGVRKFYQYISGRHFTILTDHKPLLRIFGLDKSLPVMALQRLHRCAMMLMGHDYDIRYRYSAEHNNAYDRKEEVGAITSEVQQIATGVICVFPITSKLVGECTKKDTIMSQVLNFVRNGWPTSGPEGKIDALKTYFNAQMEISDVNGVLLRDCRVIVPHELHTKVISILHQSRREIVRMKTMAQLYVWWPNIEKSIETYCKACNVCAVTAPAPAVNFAPWPIPDTPWDRVHVDFAGPSRGSMWLLAMDAHSKWPSIIRRMNYPTTEITIAGLDALFTSWATKDPCIGQWSTVCVSSIRKLVPVEWHRAHDLRAISSAL